MTLLQSLIIRALNVVCHAPLWALVGIVAQSFASTDRASLLVEAVGIFEPFVAPDFHDLAVLRSGGFDGGLPQCRAQPLTSGTGVDIKSLERTICIRNSHDSVVNNCPCSVGKCGHEVDGDGTDDLPVKFGDKELIAFVKVKGFNVVQIFVVAIWKPAPVILVIASSNDGLDCGFVGASSEADLHAEEFTGLTPFSAWGILFVLDR